MKKIIIAHGWGNKPTDIWFPWAKKTFEAKGYQVIIPQLPDSDHPKIGTWIPALKAAAGEVNEETVMIGFSMGGQTIMRFLEGLPEGKMIGKVIFVAGFGPYLKGLEPEEEPIWKPWKESPIDYEKVRSKASSFSAFFSDNDPWVKLEENSRLFKEKFDAKIIIKHNMSHFNEAANVTELPDLLKLI